LRRIAGAIAAVAVYVRTMVRGAVARFGIIPES
jgi:hypothetical protein